MAVFKPSNHSPNLSEIDLTQKNEFNCQVNTSGESIRAYKLQILSERGDEVICDGKKRTINGVTYENAGIDCSPIKNKGFLKISDISQGADIISGKSLENGKNYQWGLRTYGAPIGSKDQPRTIVCEGYIVGSTQYVIWVNMGDATEKDRKVANDNLQSDRYIEFNIPKDQISDSILPFSENYNNSNNLKYPPIPNNSDKSSYVKRQKINWVEKELGENKTVTKIECEENFDYNYKDGTPFDIYLCSDQHTPNSVFIDPNDQIELSNFIIIYNNEEDYNAAIKAGDTPATASPKVTPRNKATKIYGYSSDTGEIRVRDPFDPVPINGNYYRIFEYDIVNKVYKEKTGGTQGKKQVIGGSPIQNTLFKVYSNKWTGTNKDEENRIFIQPNINIKTDATNPNELVFDDKTRIDINQILDKTTYPNKIVDITFDKLDNTQWLLKGSSFSVVQNSGNTLQIGTASYPLPKTNYTVYTDFMDSAPYNMFYARLSPYLDIGYTNLNKKSSSLGKDEITDAENPENKYVNYRDIYFRTPWHYFDDSIPTQDVKYYHYKLYDEDGTLIQESQDIYSVELFKKEDGEYISTLDWSFKGLESGIDKNNPKSYLIELIVTDEYGRDFISTTELKVYYDSYDGYVPLEVKQICEEQALQISANVPHCADTNSYIDSEGNTINTVDEEDVVGRKLIIPQGETLNYTTTRTVNGETVPIIIPENVALITRIQITNDFIEQIENGEDKEIIRFGNKRYTNKSNNEYVIDEYSLRVGNFNGFYKINEGTENEKYVKNDKQLKLSWYKTNGETGQEIPQPLNCFNNEKDNYQDIRKIDYKNFKFRGITTLKYNLQEKDNIKIIEISEQDINDFYVEEDSPFDVINQLLNKINIKNILKEKYPSTIVNDQILNQTRILLQNTYDTYGNDISSKYFNSGIYVYDENNDIYNKWEHDLTVAYIYADDLSYFSSNTGVNIENLEVPSNCIDEENINNLKWIEDNNVWVDNDYEEEIEKINKELFDNSWFVIYFIVNNGKYKSEIRLQK